MSNFQRILLHTSLLIPAVHITYLANPGSSLFSWHPALMTIGFFTLLNEGILIFSPSLSLTGGKFRPWNMTIHATLQSLAAAAIIFGFLAIYFNKDEHGKPHFTSWHGLLGLITIVIFLTQSTLGAVARYGHYLKALSASNKLFRLLHVLVGTFSLLFVLVSLILALYTNWFTYAASGLAFYVYAALFTVVTGIVFVRTVRENKRLAALL